MTQGVQRLERVVVDKSKANFETLRLGIERGVTPARRQVAEVFEQAKKYGADEGFFVELAATASPADGQLPASLASDLSANAGQAAVAYRSLADFLAHRVGTARTAAAAGVGDDPENGGLPQGR